MVHFGNQYRPQSIQQASKLATTDVGYAAAIHSDRQHKIHPIAVDHWREASVKHARTNLARQIFQYRCGHNNSNQAVMSKASTLSLQCSNTVRSSLRAPSRLDPNRPQSYDALLNAHTTTCPSQSLPNSARLLLSRTS
jgi:hypothetical protein